MILIKTKNTKPKPNRIVKCKGREMEGKQHSVEGKIFDTFLCFQQEKPPPHSGGRCFASPVLQVGSLNAASLWVAGGAEKVKQDLTPGYNPAS